MSREYTNKLVAMIDDCVLDASTVALACINYMSEADVQDMMESEGWVDDEIEEELEDDTAEDEFVSVMWMSPEGVKLRSVPETDACEGCHYDDDSLSQPACKNAPSCAGIIWVESKES